MLNIEIHFACTFIYSNKSLMKKGIMDLMKLNISMRKLALCPKFLIFAFSFNNVVIVMYNVSHTQLFFSLLIKINGNA